MAIDPSISLQVRPPAIPQVEIQTPLEQYGKILSLRGLMQQGQLRDMQLREAQQEMQDTQSLRSWIQANPDATPEQAVRANPTKMGLAYGEAQAKFGEQKLKQDAATIDYHQKQTKEAASIMQSMVDDTTKNDGLGRLHAKGYITDDVYQRYINTPFKDPGFQNIYTSKLNEALETDKLLTETRNKINDQLTNSPKLRIEALNRLAPAFARGGNDFAAALSQETPEIQRSFANVKDYNDLLTRAMTPSEISQARLSAIGKTEPHAQAVQDQILEQEKAKGEAQLQLQLKGEQLKYAPLIPVVMKDPKLWAGLGTEAKQAISPALQAQGFNFAAAEKPTAAQETVASYAARIKQANPTFDNITQRAIEQGWNQTVPDWAGFLKTDKGKIFQQAEKNFINATLRRESGAVINPSEFVEARQQYIPQPNDPPEVLEMKRRNRLVVQQAFIHAAGPAYVEPDELLRQAGGGKDLTTQDSTALPPGWTPAMKSSGPKDEPKQVWIGPNGNISTRPPKMHLGHWYIFDGTQWVRQ